MSRNGGVTVLQHGDSEASSPDDFEIERERLYIFTHVYFDAFW